MTNPIRILILAAAVCLAASAASLPQYLDLNTNMVLGVNIRAAAQSPLIMKAIEQAGGSSTPIAGAIVQQLLLMVAGVYVTGNVDGV